MTLNQYLFSKEVKRPLALNNIELLFCFISQFLFYTELKLVIPQIRAFLNLYKF